MRSATPEFLARHGFITPAGDTATYYAPDGIGGTLPDAIEDRCWLDQHQARSATDSSVG